MSDLNGIFILTAGVFVGSVALGYVVTKLSRRRKPPVPEINAVLRILSAGSVYRAHFVGAKPQGWAFTPPLQRDAYVPLQVGEPLVLETVIEGGVMICQTVLKERHQRPPLMIVETPRKWRVEDRREAIRIGEVGHLPTKLDGDKVGLIDVSACGARIRSQADRTPGERVKLEIAGLAEAVYAAVLDVDRRGDRYIVRLRFESPADVHAIAR